jgi:hypothetical protein
MMNNSIRDTETAALAGAIGLFGIGLLLSHYTVLYAGAMTGAGHGIFTPVLLTCSRPWTILLPFLMAGANVGWKRVRTLAKGLVCFYYIWLLFNLAKLSEDYDRIADKDSAGIFWIWAGLVLLSHALIWLPVPVIRLCRTNLGRNPGPN